MRRIIAVTVAVLAVARVANATITDVHWESLNGDPAVTSSVQNTLFTTVTNDWTNAVIEIDLTSGSLLDQVSLGLGHNLRAGGNVNDSWLDAPNRPIQVGP